MLPELVDFLNLPAVALVALDAMRHFAELALLHVQARRGHSLLLLLLQVSCHTAASNCVLEPGYHNFPAFQVIADRARGWSSSLALDLAEACNGQSWSDGSAAGAYIATTVCHLEYIRVQVAQVLALCCRRCCVVSWRDYESIRRRQAATAIFQKCGLRHKMVISVEVERAGRLLLPHRSQSSSFFRYVAVDRLGELLISTEAAGMTWLARRSDQGRVGGLR